MSARRRRRCPSFHGASRSRSGSTTEFLRDGIDSVPSDEVQLKLISPLRPGLIQGEADDYST